MTDRTNNRERFTAMVPLLLLTGCLMIAVGLTVSVYGFRVLDLGTGLYELGIAIGSLGVAGLSGLAHLGRPGRAPLALRRVNRSWLSREVFFGGVLLCGLVVALTTGYYGHFRLSRSAILIATVAGLVSVWSVGMLYRLPGRRTWSTLPAALSPLVGSLLLGVLWLFMTQIRLESDFEQLKRVGLIFCGIGVLDQLLAALRLRTMLKVTVDPGVRLVYPRPARIARTIFVVRIFILPLSLLAPAGGWGWPAVAGCGLFYAMVDRLGFYVMLTDPTPGGRLDRLRAERMRLAQSGAGKDAR